MFKCFKKTKRLQVLESMKEYYHTHARYTNTKEIHEQYVHKYFSTKKAIDKIKKL